MSRERKQIGSNMKYNNTVAKGKVEYNSDRSRNESTTRQPEKTLAVATALKAPANA